MSMFHIIKRSVRIINNDAIHSLVKQSAHHFCYLFYVSKPGVPIRESYGVFHPRPRKANAKIELNAH